MMTEFTWPLAGAVAALLLFSAALLRWQKIPLAKDSLIAHTRAVIQLVLVALVIVAAARHLWSTALVIIVMITIAAYTSTDRIGADKKTIGWTWLSFVVALLPTVIALVLAGAMPADGIAIIPIIGILVGSIMSVHTLGGRAAFKALRDEHDVLEQLLALGVERPVAIREVTHRHIPDAIVTTIDTARTAGLVKLPGAFLGVMLGGGSAIQAATAQVVVLIGIFAGSVVSVIAEHHLINRELVYPEDPILGDGTPRGDSSSHQLSTSQDASGSHDDHDGSSDTDDQDGDQDNPASRDGEHQSAESSEAGAHGERSSAERDNREQQHTASDADESSRGGK